MIPAGPHRPTRRAVVLAPTVLRAVALGVVLLGLAGCDKCGNRVNINVPTLQHACGDNAQPAR